MSQFKEGQLVKQTLDCGAAHYAVVLSPEWTVGWVNNSTIELKSTVGQDWETESTKYPCLEWTEIKENIKAFREALKTSNSPEYSVVKFNCEHWATWMLTGRSYSSQVGAARNGSLNIVGGSAVVIGSSTGAVVSAASLLGASASTGTAIGSLSGAAATNAALAWLGGGTIAAGGGGVAAGTAIVTTVATAGTGLAAAGVGIIGYQVWKNMGRKKRIKAMTLASQPSAASAANPEQAAIFLDQLLA